MVLCNPTPCIAQPASVSSPLICAANDQVLDQTRPTWLILLLVTCTTLQTQRSSHWTAKSIIRDDLMAKGGIADSFLCLLLNSGDLKAFSSKLKEREPHAGALMSKW